VTIQSRRACTRSQAEEVGAHRALVTYGTGRTAPRAGTHCHCSVSIRKSCERECRRPARLPAFAGEPGHSLTHREGAARPATSAQPAAASHGIIRKLPAPGQGPATRRRQHPPARPAPQQGNAPYEIGVALPGGRDAWLLNAHGPAGDGSTGSLRRHRPVRLAVHDLHCRRRVRSIVKFRGVGRTTAGTDGSPSWC
jgi:hypothetical protein